MNPPKMQKLQRTFGTFLASFLVLVGLASAAPAHAQSPGLDAVEAYKNGHRARPPVTNRFFLKSGRLEIAPMFGYVPNNQFARRFVGAADVGFHFSESWSAHVLVQYAPDLGENDLKDLAGLLLRQAETQNPCNGPNPPADCGSTQFTQPLDKVVLGAAVGVAWAPVYGKINLVGETVLNFDFYVFVGAGMVSKNTYSATFEENPQNPADVINLGQPVANVGIGPYIGIGQNYFVNQMMAIKLDLRTALYLDEGPDYDVTDGQNPGLRLYNNLVAGVGVSLFFPKMKPRLYNF